MQRILIAEDDHKQADLIRLYLEQAGYSVLVAHDGRQAIELARQRRPDLLLLDLMMPEVDGLDVCRILKQESDVPIVMVTARSTEDDVLFGLDLGADDYVTKPYSPRELVARVRALLRRSGSAAADADAVYGVGELLLDGVRHEVRMAGEPVAVTPGEFAVLAVLMREPGRAFSRADLLQEAFGFDYEGLDRTADVHIKNLRRKIERDAAEPSYIETVYGVGYRMREPDHAD